MNEKLNEKQIEFITSLINKDNITLVQEIKPDKRFDWGLVITLVLNEYFRKDGEYPGPHRNVAKIREIINELINILGSKLD